MFLEYYNKKVEIIATNGRRYRGFVDELWEADETEDEKIELKTDEGKIFEFTQEDIESIRII